ncbi:EamA family transporter [soil metagenome]
MQSIPWWLYALLGALCAALVSIFGKVGMKNVDSDLATAVRSVVQAAFVVGFAFAMGVMNNIRQVHGKVLAMIVLSGVAGGLSWIFMFRALQKADVAQVGPIDKLSMPLAIVLAVVFLHERPTSLNWVGIAMIVVGVYLAAHRVTT